MSHFGLRYLVELDKRQTSHLNSSQLSFFYYTENILNARFLLLLSMNFESKSFGCYRNLCFLVFVFC